MTYQYLLIDTDNTLMDFNAAEAKALVDRQQKSLRCPHFRFNMNIIEQTSAEVAEHTAWQD